MVVSKQLLLAQSMPFRLKMKVNLFHLLSEECLILSKLYCSVAFAVQTFLLREGLKCYAEVNQKYH